MKKILIIALAAFFSFSCSSQTIKASWLLDENGLARLDSEMKKYDGKLITVDISKCKIPEDKYGLKRIPEETFSKNKNIKKIIFSKDADFINYRQFSGCENLTEIIFPDKVKEFSNYVFSGCKSLKKITLPKTVEKCEIPLSDFFNCEALEEIVMPENLKWLSCKTSTEKLPSSIKKITVFSYPINILTDSNPSSGVFFRESDYDFKVSTPSAIKSYNEFYNDCYAYSMNFRPKEVYFTSIKSSSSLGEKYDAKNISSGDWKCWAEGKKGSGEGEWIEVNFSEPTTIYMISLKNGFGNLAYFWKNNRIKDMELILDDDVSNPLKLTLEDSPECQNFYIERNDKPYSKMRLVIKSVYEGTDPDDDTCLDELAVNMTFLRASEMEWDAYYSTNEKGYVYDPETARMLKELFIMDVGEKKVGTTKDGRITVKANDWEMGTEYTSVISGALTGTLFHGFWPGTGGGHEYYKYKIILMENGNHILAEWLDYGDGSIAKHPLEGLYIWKNQKWISCKDSSINPAEYGIENILKLTEWLDMRNIKWDFYVDEDSITISPRIMEAYDGNYLHFNFAYDTKKISDYKKEAANIIVNGSADELKKNPDWKNNLPSEYKNANMLVVAAAFNPNPSMIKYLLESGYKINDPFVVDEYHEVQTPLEACLFYDNKSVLKALLDGGASYSPKILLDAMDKRNLMDVEKYAELVKSYDKALIHVSRIYSNEKYYGKGNMKGTLDYIKKLIIIFKEKGIDINAYASDDEKGRKEYHSICGDAIYTMDLDYIKTCVDAGCKIPERIEAYGDPTPIEYAVREYLSGNDEDEDAIKRRKEQKPVLDYLLSKGASVNAPEGETEWYSALYEICATDYWQQSKIDMIKLLIEKGIDVNMQGKQGKTALCTFIEHNDRNLDNNYQKQVLNLLLENGAETREELFKISYSDGEFKRKFFDLLFNSMKDVTYVSFQERRTLLTYILEGYRLQESSYYALKKILERDFDMYSKASEETFNQRKQTPFISFIYHAMKTKLSMDKVFEIYDLLMKHGANVNETTKIGETPFSTVMENINEGNISQAFILLQMLIKDGANAAIKNCYGDLYLEEFFSNMYYVDEDDPSDIVDSWKNLDDKQLDKIAEIAKILISNGTSISERKMKKLHVPEDVIKCILN